jgi:YggT family protein
VTHVLCVLISAYIIVLLLRAVLSWFPIRPGTTMAAVTRLLSDLTEPVVAPVRRMIPPAGMFDVAFMVVFFGLLILLSIICPGTRIL